MARINLEEIRQMLKEGDLDEAQSSLAQMLIDNPKDEAAWLLLAEIMPPDQAQESLQRVLEINPDNNEAQLRLAQLLAPLPEPPPGDVSIPIVELPESGAAEDKPHLATEDMNLEELIRSLEEKAEMLPEAQPAISEEQSEETPVADESFLAGLVQENPPEPETRTVEEQTPVDEGSFALESEEDTLATYPPGPDKEEETSQEAAVTEDTVTEDTVTEETVIEVPVREEAPQAVQDFSIPEEEQIAEERKGKKPRKKSRRAGQVVPIIISVLILLCILVGGYSWWVYFFGPCGVEKVIEADKAMSSILTRWDESMMVAMNSSRVVLAEPLRRLVDIRGELKGVETPACMIAPKDTLDRSMQYTLEAYDKLFNYENDAEIGKRFNMAKTQRKYFEQQMDYIRQCAPLFCQ